jgi:hypothetical protein
MIWMSVKWRRYRSRLRLLTLAVAGATAGLLVSVWIPDGRAAILGGAVTAVLTALMLGVQAQWRQRSDVIRQLPAALEISSVKGQMPLVSELSDPIAVGVHPAEAIEVNRAINRVPAYITRDIEPDLHAALRRSDFVLVVGESTAGKTRVAFEAIRLLQSNCRFVAPSSRDAIPGLLDSLSEAGDYVVWLDDLERFLGPSGLTLSVLGRITSQPVRTVVLATMRSHEFDRYRDRVEGELIGPDRDVWREGRAVLRQAQVIHLDRRWSEQEQLRAQAYKADRRLARALDIAADYGIAETLAAGPELAETWMLGWTPNHHPRGAALVAAAVDARRVGYHRPLPLTLLQRMHEGYLIERGGSKLRPESMQEALLWATTPTFPNGANSLLIGSPDEGYLAFDYLIDLQPADTIPGSAWSTLVESVSSVDAYIIAEHAVRAGYFDRSIIAYRWAAEHGNMVAEAVLKDLGMPIRPPEESLTRALEYLQNVQKEYGPDHQNSFVAEQSVISMTMYTGRYDHALVLLENMLERSERVLGPAHRVVLAAKYSRAVCTYRLGAEEKGLAELDAAILEATSALGLQDSAVASRRIDVVTLLCQSGHLNLARERLAVLNVDYSDFAPDHFITVQLRKATSVVGLE